MTDNGFIKLDRGIRGHWLWSDPRRLQWWIDMVMEAGFDSRKTVVGGVLVNLNAGDFVASARSLSERWGATRRTAESFLKDLENDGLIRRQILCHRISVITICNNVCYFTDSTSDSTSDGTSDSTSDGTTSKEGKEWKEGKEDDDGEYTVQNHEASPSSPLVKVSALVSRYTTDTSFREYTCRQLGISDEAFNSGITAFGEFLRNEKNTATKTDTDFRQHFINWMRKSAGRKAPAESTKPNAEVGDEVMRNADNLYHGIRAAKIAEYSHKQGLDGETLIRDIESAKKAGFTLPQVERVMESRYRLTDKFIVYDVMKYGTLPVLN